MCVEGPWEMGKVCRVGSFVHTFREAFVVRESGRGKVCMVGSFVHTFREVFVVCEFGRGGSVQDWRFCAYFPEGIWKALWKIIHIFVG